MLFKSFLISALAATSVAQKISAAKTVENIESITTLSKNLDGTAKTVTLLNGFQTGPEVIQGFHQIVQVSTKAYHEMEGGSSKRNVGSIAGRAMLAERQSTTYTIAQQEAVCNAFITFVKVHQALLATVIGKHGILEVTGVAYQVAAVLRGVEGVVDEIAFTLIAEVPHCAAEANAAKQNLDNSLVKSIDTYANGLP